MPERHPVETISLELTDEEVMRLVCGDTIIFDDVKPVLKLSREPNGSDSDTKPEVLEL